MEYSIMQVAEKLKVHVQTLRKWEKDFDIKVPRNPQGHRYYTDTELKVFENIQKMKDKGANIHVIKKILRNSEDAMEQKQKALELATLNQLTGVEFKELIATQLSQVIIERENELEALYEEKLDAVKDEIKEEIRQEFTKQQEQRVTENQKLIDYIAVSRDIEKKKSFWNIFRK